MKYKIEYKLIISLVVVLFLCACSEDKGNYNYKTLNDIEISGIEDFYLLEQFDKLTITPQLAFNLEQDESNLEHFWYAYSATQNKQKDTLSVEKNLDITIGLVPDTYSAMYKVTNKETGVFYTYKFIIQTIGTLTNGLFILGETQDNKANIALLSASGKLHEDIYHTANGEYAGTKPVALGNMNTLYDDQILVFCDNENGGCIVDPNDFSKKGDCVDLFWIKPTFPKFRGYNYSTNDSYEYIFTDNAFYFNAYRRSPPPHKLGQPAIDDVNIVTPAMNKVFFYDNKGEGFIQINTMSYVAYPVESMPDSIFDPANIGMQLLSGGEGFQKYFYGLFYDDENSSYHTLIASIETAAGYYFPDVKPIEIVDITSATDIEKASCFLTSSLSPQFFYTVENKLYCLGAETNITNLVHSFDAGEKIDYIEFDKLSSDRVMWVGTSKAGEGKTGSVYLLDVDLNGTVSISDKYENIISGKVVDFMYR